MSREGWIMLAAAVGGATALYWLLGSQISEPASGGSAVPSPTAQPATPTGPRGPTSGNVAPEDPNTPNVLVQ